MPRIPMQSGQMPHRRPYGKPVPKPSRDTQVLTLSGALDISNELRECFQDEVPTIKATDMLRTQGMWVRFNMLSDALDRMAREEDGLTDGLGVSEHNDLCWAIVNRLLNLPRSEYDFNAFTPIHSMGEFKEAMEHCASATISGIWVKRVCPVCGQTFGLEYNTVMEFQKRDARLPICCDRCGGDKYVNRVMILRPRLYYNTFAPYRARCC